MTWRPVTSIPLADTDGNPDTAADPGWLPLITTPSHPEYPAGHPSQNGAAATVLLSHFRRRQTFTLTTTGQPSRTYTSIAQARSDGNNARVWGGMHYPSTVAISDADGRGDRQLRQSATHAAAPRRNDDDGSRMPEPGSRVRIGDSRTVYAHTQEESCHAQTCYVPSRRCVCAAASPGSRAGVDGSPHRNRQGRTGRRPSGRGRPCQLAGADWRPGDPDHERERATALPGSASGTVRARHRVARDLRPITKRTSASAPAPPSRERRS